MTELKEETVVKVVDFWLDNKIFYTGEALIPRKTVKIAIAINLFLN